MRFAKFKLLCCQAIFVMAWPVQAAEDSSPQNVATSYFSALKSSDYLSAANLFRAADLEHFKSAFTPIFEAESRNGKRDLLDATFGKDATVETAMNAAPEQVFANVVSFVFNANPTARPTLERMEILGAVEEPAQQLVHVLTRNFVKVGAVESSQVEVLTMAKESSQWKMVMSDQMRAIGQIIRNSMNAR